MDEIQKLPPGFKWELNTTLKDLARDYEIRKNNLDLHRVFFMYKGESLPQDKTLKELRIDPNKDQIIIKEMYIKPLFDHYSLD